MPYVCNDVVINGPFLSISHSLLQPRNYEIRQVPVPQIGDDEVLVKGKYHSLLPSTHLMLKYVPSLLLR